MNDDNAARSRLTAGAAFAGAGVLTMGLMTAAPPSDAFKSEPGSVRLAVSTFSPMAYSTQLLQRFNDSALPDLSTAAITSGAGAGIPPSGASSTSAVSAQPISAASISSESGQSWLAPTLVAVCAITIVCGVVAAGLIVGSVVLAPVLYPVLKLVLPILSKIRDAIAGLLGLPSSSAATARVASANPVSRTRGVAESEGVTPRRGRPNVLATQDRSRSTVGSVRPSPAKRSAEGRARHGSR